MKIKTFDLSEIQENKKLKMRLQSEHLSDSTEMTEMAELLRLEKINLNIPNVLLTKMNSTRYITIITCLKLILSLK